MEKYYTTVKLQQFVNFTNFKIYNAIMIVIMAGFSFTTSAQNVGVNTSTPDAAAALDVRSAAGKNQGILPPSVALTGTTDASTIIAPPNSLLVYNTATAGSAPNNVTPGYYYNSGTAAAPVWTKFEISNSNWKLTGNAGTTAGTNFLGTTDAQDVVLKRNGAEQARITSSGIGVGGSTSPTNNTGTGSYLHFGQAGNITGTSGLDIGIDQDNNSTNSNLRIIKDAGTELVRVQEDGNVGINTATPDSKLDVEGGSIRITGTTNTNAETGGMLIYANTNGLGGGTAKKVERATFVETSGTSNSSTIFDDPYITLRIRDGGSVGYLSATPKSGETGTYSVYSSEGTTYAPNLATAGTFVDIGYDFNNASDGINVIMTKRNLTNPPVVYKIFAIHCSSAAGASPDRWMVIVEAYYF